MSERLNILVTGGAGFIGSALCRHLVRSGRYRVVNLDKLTYAGNLEFPDGDRGQSPDYRFVQGDICDQAGGARLAARPSRSTSSCIWRPRAMSTARSTAPRPSSRPTSSAPSACSTRRWTYWRGLPEERKTRFRFHHVSTDEVFGDLPLDEGIFTEDTPYAPVLALIRRPRPRRTISSAPGTRPTACRWCSPTARTITGPTSFRRS